MYHVLFVDDEPMLLAIAKLILEETGEFFITTITSAPEALAIMESVPFDAVVSDYHMPLMDGIQLLKEIRVTYEDLPFILFTGRGREDVVIEAINNGVDAYLQKGGDPTSEFAELAHMIQKRGGTETCRRRTETGRKPARNARLLLPDGRCAAQGTDDPCH